jgi:hypothetical protein
VNRARRLLSLGMRRQVPGGADLVPGGSCPGHEVEEVRHRRGACPERGTRRRRQASRVLAGVDRGGRRGRRVVPREERPEMRVPALQASIRALVVVLRLLGARHEVEEVAPPPPSAPRGARGRRLGRGLDLQARRRGARGRRGRRPVQRHELPAGEELVGGRERRRRRGHDVELELVAVGLSHRRRQGRGAVEREGIRRGRGHRCGSHCRGRRGMNARGGVASGNLNSREEQLVWFGGGGGGGRWRASAEWLALHRVTESSEDIRAVSGCRVVFRRPDAGSIPGKREYTRQQGGTAPKSNAARRH